MAGRPSISLPPVPLMLLSRQQAEIYRLARLGLSNREIAIRLDLRESQVATQLSRIRRKAAQMKFTYKSLPGAEHALGAEKNGADRKCAAARPGSPAYELKQKMETDPGFFQLMRRRYGSDLEDRGSEEFFLTASLGIDRALRRARAACIKIQTVGGGGSGVVDRPVPPGSGEENGTIATHYGRVVLRLSKEERVKLGEYLYSRKIRPVEIFREDGSAVYIVTLSDFNAIRSILTRV